MLNGLVMVNTTRLFTLFVDWSIGGLEQAEKTCYFTIDWSFKCILNNKIWLPFQGHFDPFVYEYLT
jgi:hypothetical protein